MAVVLLRGVAALDAKACLEWGYPKEGKWQHDDDCCAGEKQAACAAGYRYVKGCVEMFVLNHRVVLHAIDATPARWRGDAGSLPLDRARTAASSPRNDLVKNCRVHPTHC